LSWINLIIEVQKGEAEALSNALAELGALAVSIEDAAAGSEAEQAIFGEPGMATDALWERCRVTALLAPESNVRDLVVRAAVLARLVATPDFAIHGVQDADWVRITQAQFAPIQISSRLWIVPTWHSAPDPSAINIVLDPGVAFGTGSHPTTKLCLRWLDQHIEGGETLLDYGCGSGILAIAALRLGAGAALGIDIDPQAVAAARQNAQHNGTPAIFSLPTAEPIRQADITIANILPNPLKLLSSVLARHTRPGGHIVLSGILSTQREVLSTCYAPWVTLSTYAEEEGWVCLHGKKHGK
jgi:ribosomal protein L11 methyltransferase